MGYAFLVDPHIVHVEPANVLQHVSGSGSQATQVSLADPFPSKDIMKMSAVAKVGDLARSLPCCGTDK
jgi:hypothetical protein